MTPISLFNYLGKSDLILSSNVPRESIHRDTINYHRAIQ